tara:strand:- start:2572 stop:3966 length:1395 start_codon:yes stop_codon:yes gene_type:complete
MFKKIEVWILYLTLLVSILIAIGFGVLVRQEIEGVTKFGKINISFFSKPAAYIARLPEKSLRLLLKPNINRINDPWDENRYFYNQDGFKGKPSSYESYLLLSRYDGDLKEGIVELVDLMNFEILHTWNPDIDKFNDLIRQENEFKFLSRDDNNKRKTLIHPKLTKDGGLLFGWNAPIRKIDECSKLIFQNSIDIFHHSIEEDIAGDIWIPSHIYPQTLPAEKVGRNIPAENGFLDDAIVKLDKNGKILYEKSVSQIFIENGLEYLLFSSGDLRFVNDPIHLNDIQPVNYDGDYWKKGDVFLSLRHQSMVILFRPSTNKIIWKGTGPFFHQHDVDIINNHTISIFDNNSKVFHGGRFVDGNNRVIIYDFKNNQYSTYLSDSLIKNDVRTPNQGRSEILPNKDLLIEESFYARLLYFNANGSLRWSHVNKASNEEIYKVGWSRIMHTEEDIEIVKNFMKTKEVCNE